MAPPVPEDDRPIYPEDRGSGARRFLVILLLLLLLLGMGTCGWYGAKQGWFERDADPVVSTEALPVEPIETTEYVGAPETDADAVVAGTISPLEGSDWFESDIFEGTDASGRTGKFRIFILGEQYAWTFEQSRNVETDTGPASLAGLFTGEGVRERYCNASHLLGIGTASFEGTAEFNRNLSNKRARNLVDALEANAPACDSGDGPAFLAGSLGEHVETMQCSAYGACARMTRPQRRVLLVGVVSEDAALNIGEALKDGLRGFDRTHAQFFKGFRIADYDAFELLD
jgi:hypothetical protein